MTRPPTWWSKADSLPISAGRPKPGDRRVKFGRESSKGTSIRADRLPVGKAVPWDGALVQRPLDQTWSPGAWDGALGQLPLDNVDNVESCFFVELLAVVRSILHTKVAIRRRNVI